MTTYQTTGDYLLAWQHDYALTAFPIEMAADALGVARAEIEQLLNNGDLPAINIANQRYISAAALAKSVDNATKALAKDAEKEKKLVNATISTLKTAARLGIVISYDSLRRAIGISDCSESDAITLDRILNLVHNESQPIYTSLLPVLLRKEASIDAMPPDSLFIFARKIGLTVQNERRFTQDFTHILWDFFSKAPKK